MAESKPDGLTGVLQESASTEFKKRDRLPWDDVAARLLQEKLLLTALELHTELSEAGYELPRLRDYFSNPANFEQYTAKNYSDIGPGSSTLNRSSSQTTLDSLDWGHLSEDGERVNDERVAVLEFELRKAKETIQGLRTNLTQVAETKSSEESQDGTIKSTSSTLLSSLQSHEKRTINFLINEYLVTNTYKLTAITFADENDDQDFEHWDDVGLNVARPPNLVQLLRNSGQSFAQCANVHCQTEDIEQQESSIPLETQAEITSLRLQLEEMKIALSNSERDLKELQQRTSTPIVTPLNTPKKSLLSRRLECPDSLEIDGGRKSPEGTSDTEETSVGAPSGFVMVTPPDRHDKSIEVHHTESYDQERETNMAVRGPLIGLDACLQGFEVHTESIEDAIETGYREKQYEEVQSPEPYDTTESSKDNVDSTSISTLTESVIETPGLVEDISVVQSPTDSISKAESIDYASIPVESSAPMTESEKLKHIQHLKSEARDLLRSSSERLPSDKFENQILTAGLQHTILSESHLQSAVTVVEPSLTDLLQVVVKSLHNIAPNVILAKREELLPLLIYGVSLHPEAKERERLLYLLFNLIKRPDDSQRNTILMGLVSLARVLGETRLEAELLPQCWEQLNHKYMERRLLVAQSTAALAPYTPPTLRNSLLLSMLQQIVAPGGEKEPAVRESALISLSLLITYLDDQSKISPLVDILIHCLEYDSSTIDTLPLSPESSKRTPSNIVTSSTTPPTIFQDGTESLLMSLGMWVLECNCLNLLLEPIIVRISQLATQLHQYHGDIDNVQNYQTTQVTLVAVVNALRKMVPFLIAVLINTLPNLDDSSTNNSSFTTLPPTSSSIEQLEIILGSKDKANTGLMAFYHHVSKEWYKTWPELDYVTQEMIPTLVGVLRHIDASGQNHVQAFVKLFSELSILLGHHLTSSTISPLFMKHLSIEDTELDAVKRGTTGLTRAMVVVYSVALLAPSENSLEDKNELEGFLSRNISILALCKASMEAINVTISILMQTRHYQEIVLTALWSCLVHKSPSVRACSAGLWGIVIGCVEDGALGSRVVPALVTLATDQDLVARTSALQPLATVITTTNKTELLDKVWLQLESLCEDASMIDNKDFQIALAQTCVQLSASSHTKLLQQFLLPRLSRLVTGGHIKDDSKHSVSLVVLDAYSAFSCLQLPDHVIAHFIIPALQQLQKTLGISSFEHMEIITDLLQEYSLRASTTQEIERRTSIASIGSTLPVHPGVDEMKNKMSKMFSSRGPSATNVLQAKAQAMNVNLPGFFKKK